MTIITYDINDEDIELFNEGIAKFMELSEISEVYYADGIIKNIFWI